MIQLRILGTLHLQAPGGHDVDALVRQSKRAALLAYFAVALPRGPHRRDKLLALFWPELDESRARAALNQAVYVLRSTLGERAITSRGEGDVGLDPDVVWCDAAAFEAALDAGRFDEALSLYRGDLLDGFFISNAPEFERWLEGERARLRGRAFEGGWQLAEASATRGKPFEAVRWARWAADLFPADEAVIRRLMTFLRSLGDRAAAIRDYEAFVSRLQQEYEMEPSAETRALAAAIRQERTPDPAVRSVEAPPAALASPSGSVAAVGRRYAAGWLVAGAVGGGVLVAGAWIWLRRPTASPPIARFALEFPGVRPMAEGVVGPTIALSPDGSVLVYLAAGDQGRQLFLRPMNRTEAAPIPTTTGAYLPFFSPDGEWLGFVAEGTIRKVPLGGGPAISICRVATNVAGASWGTNGTIVFATPAGLWRVPSSGGEPRAIALADTAHREAYRWPEMLPGGRTALFTRVDRGGFRLAAVSLETGVIRSLGLEGTNPHFVSPGYVVFSRLGGALLAAPFDPEAGRITGAALPVTDGLLVGIGGAAKLGVSHAGEFAYFDEDAADRTLALVDRAGRAESIPALPHGFSAPVFSPDGRRIVTEIHRGLGGIWVLDLAQSTFRRLTFDSGSRLPVISPDGQRIAFGTNPAGVQSGYTLRWMEAEGGDSAETLLPAEPAQFPCAFRPDGRMLVFERADPRTLGDIWILPLSEEREPRPYLRTAFDERGAVLSPDGRWLAYVSNEAGEDEVYVRAFPNPGPPVAISAGGGREPRWAPSGREMFYRSKAGMVAVAVDPSASLRVGRREVLFDDRPYLSTLGRAAYDVRPDGRRFLMVRRGTEVPQVVVLLNWFDQRDLTRGALVH